VTTKTKEEEAGEKEADVAPESREGEGAGRAGEEAGGEVGTMGAGGSEAIPRQVEAGGEDGEALGAGQGARGEGREEEGKGPAARNG